VHVCTVINRAWIAHARALAESLLAHQGHSKLSVLVVDPLESYIDPAQERFELLAPSELEIEGFAAMSARYDVTELCCALKPSLVRHLLAAGDDTVVYLDSDVRVYAPLDGLEEALAQHPLLLTPHLLGPLPDDGLEPSELAILLAGASNLGFLAARSTPETDAVLAWWAERLRTSCRLDPAHAMVYDQRWADLMPGLSEAVGIWRDPGANFGYWRAVTSRVERGENGVLVDGRPLRFLHFSGYELDRPERMSRFENRPSLERNPLLGELGREFGERLLAHGHAEASKWPYGFGATAAGAPLTPLLRKLWDRADREGAVSEPPFSPEGEQEFLRWLAEPERGTAGQPLSRYLRALHAERPELQARFPDLDGDDRRPFLEWAGEQAERNPSSVAALLAARQAQARRPGLHRLERGETVDAERGEVVVCIPVYGALELFAECLSSVLANTSAEIPILIADDASPDPAIEAFVVSLATSGRLERREVIYLRQPQNVGFPRNVNAAFEAAAPADVVVLNSDCVVAEGWLEGLRRAAYSDELVATASSLTNHGTILSVPERNTPRPGLPQDTQLERAAGAVLEQSLRLYPRLPTAIGHCMYVRRHALELVGSFDPAFSPGYGEEVDFSQRCALHGLVHVAADDVFVLHHSGGSLGEDGEINPVREQHERIVNARYPYYQRAQTAASKQSHGPLPRALAGARRAIIGLRATIDARCLGPVVTGTQVHTLEVIRALSRAKRLGLRVIVPPDLSRYAAAQLSDLPHIELIAHTDVHPAMDKTDIAHRPYQVNDANDLLVLRCTGERMVITHQDLIAYRNPGYFPGYPQWERYQRLTRQALAAADQVLFFSAHAASDALKEDLVDPDRVRVVYIGTDHTSSVSASQEPVGMGALEDRPMLLCLGTDFRHKNRLFVLRLLEALRERERWDGGVVFAGPRVSHGSSAGEEAAYLATRPELATHVIDLPAVSEAEKEWLLERSSAVVYPTTYEGFGLIPFEAAAHGKPCLLARHTALLETLPPEVETLVAWDPQASAERVHRLLSSEAAIAEHVRAIRRAGQRFSWQAAGEQLADAYWAAAASPTRTASRMALDLAKVELERDEAERKYKELWQALTPEARELLAPDGALDAQTAQTLAAVARRPLLRRLTIGTLTRAYRLAARRRAGPPAQPETPPETLALHFGTANVEHMREQGAATDPASLTPGL
jgi:glycosyltransferase involved in cell wall biosynthesis/GT2 family glycosyltransferase